jgi:hypothetical protein
MKFTLMLLVGFIPTIVLAQAPVNVLPNLRSDPLVESTETPKEGVGGQANRRFLGQNVDYVKPAAPQVAKPDTLKNSNLQELAPKAGGLIGLDPISQQLPQ